MPRKRRYVHFNEAKYRERIHPSLLHQFQEADTMTLGPNRVSWGKGSGSAGRPSQQQANRAAEVPFSTNRFDMLEQTGTGAVGGPSQPPPGNQQRYGESRRISSKSVGLPGRARYGAWRRRRDRSRGEPLSAGFPAAEGGRCPARPAACSRPSSGPG